jgi:hypothetical protein
MDYATGVYSYGRLERALGVALYAEDKATQQGALRGRLKRLATLGLPATGPGKGSRRQYSLEEAHQLLVALMMEDGGLDPTVTAAAVLKLWTNNMRRAARLAASAAKDNPILIELRLQTISGPWRTRNPHAALPWVRLTPRCNVKAFEQYTKQGLPEFEALYRADNVRSAVDSLLEEEGSEQGRGWLAVHNFSQKAAKLESVLNEERV